ncbi:MAG: tRNA (N(6)-L-threonylcarbamoyladenosine(37)-C(2))-methylthiotransferase MtaB [Candidatus Zixiibacteriota bacterium]|nr:MAG: tRNA (N(6)-L-threonylcarbamoyladenosine(37)-C(2))-methylthiotransferase MtaB [candidate division Zixibacteria bacterium]
MTISDSKTVSLQTVGCRLNQYETEKMAVDLYPYGFRRAAKDESADLYIINTCTVTHRADSSSRYLISKARRENPDSRVVVAGCYVDSEHEKVSSMEAVDLVIPNSDKSRIVEILSSHFPELFTDAPIETCSSWEVAFETFNRAWLKVSDGCNQRCAFCILPRVRGGLINRPVTEIVDDVNSLVGNGFCEIVLTGLHLGSYSDPDGRADVKTLAQLCKFLLRETSLTRIRLSSIEPQTVTDELLNVCTDAGERICRHIHIPLQSGSPNILKLMRRPYSLEQYVKRAEAIRQAIPGVTIGSDMIAGFPGETEEDFRLACAAVDSDLVDYLHVFSYSDRAQTVAAGLPDKVSPTAIKERCSTMIEISNRLRHGLHKRQINKVLAVISEHRKPGSADLFGIADNYVRVKLPASYSGGRQIVRVRITAAYENFIEGQLLG